MHALRWVGVGLVAVLGVGLAVAAGVGLVQPPKEQAATLPTTAKEAGGRRTLKSEPTEPMLVAVKPVGDFRNPPSVQEPRPGPLPPAPAPLPEEQKPIPLPPLPGDTIPLPKPAPVDPLPLPKPAPVDPVPLPKPQPIDVNPVVPPPLPVPPIEDKPKFVDPVPLPVPPVPKKPVFTDLSAIPKPVDPLPKSVEPLPKPKPFEETSPPEPKFVPEVPLPQPSTPTPPKVVAPEPHYLNKPELEFDYTVGKKGKSGVKSVTLFARDPALVGKPQVTPVGEKHDMKLELLGTWQPVDTQPVKEDGSPKLRVKLPKDGRYEFRLGVTSGNGNAATPKESDPADLVVVVDTLSPSVTKFEAKVEQTTNVVNFALKVEDVNQTGDPLIEYRTTPTGTWQPVKLTNSMAWAVPDDLPAEVAVRVTVADKAGNVTTKVIDKVNLDTTIPEGKLVKVRPADPKPEPKKDPFAPDPKPPVPGIPLPPPPKLVDVPPPVPSTPPHKVDRIK